MKTDDLVNVLVADLPVTTPRFSHTLTRALILGTLIAALVFVLGVHMRPDFAAAIETPRVWHKFAFGLSLLVASFKLTQRLAAPGEPIGFWGIALLGAPLMLALGVATEMWLTPELSWKMRLIGANARFCLLLIPMLATAPLACLLFALRRGAPTNPGVAGAVAGLLAGAVAATLYAAHCPDDSPFFLATWYSLAIAIVSLSGYGVGSRVLRW